ncbi:hypothetical protein N656DRAFT_780665 [Canariomyces notabilis]|uniref:Uncharacterized protein n=1 Tax=Canariomyces notabilis TaxID=2074819 RepID=A0AAN6TBQ6_9PEZI|nr:hypothetical protein N656DRAFT_780665 [Canariomyces arenarius]
MPWESAAYRHTHGFCKVGDAWPDPCSKHGRGRLKGGPFGLVATEGGRYFLPTLNVSEQGVKSVQKPAVMDSLSSSISLARLGAVNAQVQYGGVAVRDRRAGFLLRHVTNPAPCSVGSRSPLAFGCEKTAGSNDLDHDSSFPLIDSHSKRRFRCTAKLCKPCNALDRQFPTKLAITSWPEGCSS